ncbi:MAG: PQQ-dependent sugar dehydrogenase [Gemmataceae bacterium]|nr:PQQ-dependent sugar dehydrogenase [Gemmataceae bacterium]
MARHVFGLLVLSIMVPAGVAADLARETFAEGLNRPTAVAVGGDGRIYVAFLGDAARSNGGGIAVVAQGKSASFVDGLDQPIALAAFQQWLFVVDRQGVSKFDLKGKGVLLAGPKAFPKPLHGLTALTVDPESGFIYAIDSGDGGREEAAVYRIDPKGRVSIVTDRKRWPGIRRPTALVLDGASHLLVADDGGLYRVRVFDGKATQIEQNLGDVRGLAWDRYGRLYLARLDNGGELLAIPRPGAKVVPGEARLGKVGGICLGPDHHTILVPDADAGTITAVAAQVPGQPVDFSPLPLETVVAFPELQWTGWQGETESGKVNPLRPIVLTHAGDGSKRVFVATQHGVIHVFANDPKAKHTKVFLDIQAKVRYKDSENEEGFLGLAFHPDYRKTGEFFVFYTPKDKRLVNVVSRFRVSKSDPDKADPDSETILYSVQRPFWNHDGGTVCFGPDGMLYIALGDGGAANDPFDHAQNLKTPLGAILRIDVNRQDPGKNYAVPPDNPFVGTVGVVPEIWAYGLRNVWRMAFDKATGRLWAGDVGQNLYEEINIITKGGNYGWRRREALHPFGFTGQDHGPAFIDPIWEYHHDVGKSITGGHVYRGKQFPELDGHYLCADYVTGKIWALRYDDAAKRVTAWRAIRDKALPIMSFGEDEDGETYLLTYAASGRGIYQLRRIVKR